jgi:hypothetical protein
MPARSAYINHWTHPSIAPLIGGSRILAKGMPQQNFGVCINNDFVLEEIMSMKYNKITK